ncbi:MAG TPA: hypothetical protein VGL77_15100, partial [Armatimonadota bacterium]
MDQHTNNPHEHDELTLFAFLTELNTQTQALTHEDLVVRLVKYAETIPAEQRTAMLRHFTATAALPEEPQPYTPDPSLQGDIECFGADLRSQSFVESWDWDMRTDNEMIVTGDTSWATDMADLFARTDAAFLGEDFAVAAAAYAILLSLFTLQEELCEGVFPGEDDPVSMVGINVEETVARYLRSLLASDDAQRAKTFVAQFAEMSQQFYQQISLKAILEASPQPLADTDQWLGAVEPLFAARAQETADFSRPDWAKLLREAILLRSGVDGLGDFARERGADQPEAYYEWVLALRNEGRHDEALHAAQDAVATVQLPQAKAVLANALGRMFDARGAHEDAWCAKALAWQCYPSLYNLTVLLSHGQADVSAMLVRLDAEYARYQRGELDFSHIDYAAPSMRILFLALAGDLDRIATEAHMATGVGWSEFGHIGYSACAVLLLALLDPPALPPAGSVLATYALAIEQRAISHGLCTLIPTPNEEHAVDYLGLLLTRLTQHPVDGGRRATYRDIAKQLMLRRVEGIVGGQHRSAYDRAAQIAVAYAEA